MRPHIAIISSICIFLFFSLANADDTEWEITESVEISKNETVVFKKVVLSEGAEWNYTTGEILIEEAVIPMEKYRTKKYMVQNIPVVGDDYNAFVSPDKTKLIFVKDNKLNQYDLGRNKQQLLGEARYVKQIPDVADAYLCFRFNSKSTIIIDDMTKEEVYVAYLRTYAGNEKRVGKIKVRISQEDGGGLNPISSAEINYQNGSVTLSGRFIETITFNIK